MGRENCLINLMRVTMVSLVLVLLTIPFQSNAHAMQEVTVFAVGTNQSYKSSLGALKFAEDDAERFVRAMTTVGLVPRARATVLKDPTLNDFRQVIMQLQQPTMMAEAAANRKFIFYFSGHADDSGLHFRDGVLPKSELHEGIAAIKANTKVAIVDSCFSGSITTKGIKDAEAFELPKVELDEPSGTVFLSAASGQQLAYESDKLGSSIFTHHLIAGIYGEADGNVDGVVTVDELYQYVYKNTKWQSFNFPTKQSQEPEFVSDLRGQGAVVLSFPSQTNSRLAFEKALDGDLTIYNSQGLRYFRVRKSPGKEKIVQLPAGSYRVSIRKGNQIGTGEVSLQPTKMAFLSTGDIEWKDDNDEPVASKGVAAVKEASRPPSKPMDLDNYSHLVLGAHSGFNSGDDQLGPMVTYTRVWPVLGKGGAVINLNGELSFHRNEIEGGGNEIYTIMRERTDTSAAMGFVQIGFKSKPFMFLSYGWGQAYQDRRSEGEFLAGASMPISSVGIIAGVGRFSFTVRQDTLHVAQVSTDGTSTVEGKSFGIGYVF